MKIRDILEITETILTILVSLTALSGTFIAYKNGFFHKLKHVVDHYHEVALKAESDLQKEPLFKIIPLKKQDK